EHPPAEIGFPAGEPAKAPGNVQPDLRGQVVRLAGIVGPEVAKDGGMKVLIQGCERPFRASLRGSKHTPEIVSQAHRPVSSLNDSEARQSVPCADSNVPANRTLRSRSKSIRGRSDGARRHRRDPRARSLARTGSIGEGLDQRGDVGPLLD